MFGRKRAKISDKTPVFHVRYIGCTETYVATGTGCSYAPVQRLWDNSPAEKNMRKVAIHINPMGLKLQDQNEKSTTDTQQQQHQQQQQQHYKEFDIENISFCNVDRAVNERIFSWIYRNEQHNRLDCHAVLCSTRQKAQTMAIVLSRAFQIAYKDWRAHNRNYTAPVPPTSTVARSESKTSTASSGSGSAGFKDMDNGNGSSSSSTGATATASKPTSSAVAARNGDTLLAMAASDPENNSSLETMLHHQHAATTAPPNSNHDFYDAVSGMSGNDVRDASAKGETSSVYVQQPVTPSYFVSSSILDPEMVEVIGDVDALNADVDLEDTASY